MLGDSSSGDAASAAASATTLAAAAREGHHEGGEATAGAGTAAMAAGSSNSGEDDKGRVMDEFGERGFGGNRWPRQETLALLKIRSDMDVAFRDASVKGPLWEEVSRKLAELGYNRSAKKCKEKFENVFKYHKRTKEGRTSKGQSKTYKFFDQLEAFEHHHHPPSLSSPTQLSPPTKPHHQPPPVVSASPVSMQHPTVPTTIIAPTTTVPSTTTVLPHHQNIGTLPVTVPAVNLTNIPSFPPISTNQPVPVPQAQSQPTSNPNPTAPTAHINIPSSFQNSPTDLLSNSTSSSSTSSDYEFGGPRKRKRKWRDFFERLMKEVVDKQEELQKKFLEAIEKRERERMVREEAWRMQEMTRINREREILAQERSMAAAKDAAVMAFLQKLSEQHPNLTPPMQLLQNNTTNSNPNPPTSQPPPPQPAAPPPQQQPQLQPQTHPHQTPPPQPLQPSPPIQQHQVVTTLDQSRSNTNNGGDQMIICNSNNDNNNFMAPSSSRWPKVEVQALINLRTNLDAKYQENVPKGPLWEEISAGMRKLGYNRSAKRCKEKWENINKYFKKVKESNKKRPEDSKTCPYFNQLEALYKEKNKFDGSTNSSHSSINPVIKPENSVPLMVTPEQQWPPATTVAMMTSMSHQSQPDPHNQQQHRHDSVMEDVESDQNMDEDDEDENDDDEGSAGGFEIVANNNNKQVTMNATG